MQLNYDNISLLITARQLSANGPCLVVSVGLLYDADMGVVPAIEAQKWLVERFAKQGFEHGMQKSRGTFAVQGSAYALSSDQQQGMAVRASFGPLSKTLHIFPPRQWRKGINGWSCEPTGRLDVLPLDWQHAYGAKDYPDNPDGIGYIADPDQAEGLQLPQIEDTFTPLRKPGEQLKPVTFLPLPPQSQERLAFLGTCNKQWSKQRAPFLPLDTDLRWYDEVAQDQCGESYWTGTEYWSAAGMHPEKLEVSGRLPGFKPRLFVQRRVVAQPPDLPGDQPAIEPIEEASLQLDTAWLFPDVERVLLIYRVELSVLDIDGEDLAVLAVGLERRGETCKSREQWIAELWPQAVADPEEVPPAPAAAVVETAAVMAKLQSDINAHYARIAAAQAEGFALLQQAAEPFKQAINPAVFKPVVTPNLAAFVERSARPKKAFDPQALKAEIDSAIANAKATGEELLATSLKAAGHDPQTMLARSKKLQQELLAQPSSTADPYSIFIDQLSLPASQKEEYKQRIQAGMAKATATEAEIDGKVAAMRQSLAAKKPKLPKLALPVVAPRIVWTRELLEASHKAEEKLDGERFIDLDLSGIDLSGGVLQNCSFENCQFKQAKLTTVLFSRGRFNNCDFTQADLQQSLFDSSTFKGCTFSEAKLGKASLNAVRAEKTPFDAADLTQVQAPRAQFFDSTFTGTTLPQGDFAGARWQGCDLSGVNMQDAHLAKAQLHACTLDNADLSRSALPASSWSQVTGRAVNLSDANLQNWRIDQGCRLPALNLNNANLTKASLQYAGLENATLRGANLSKALFSRCDLSHADGYHANATSADFTGSNLSHSSWLGANFLEARLRKVSLSNADLRGSNLHGLNSEGAHGNAVRLDNALMTRCRLTEDLAHG